MKTVVVLSMLHEEQGKENAATREFRGGLVIGWTVERLQRCERIEGVVAVCWEDQAEPLTRALSWNSADRITVTSAELSQECHPERYSAKDLADSSNHFSACKKIVAIGQMRSRAVADSTLFHEYVQHDNLANLEMREFLSNGQPSCGGREIKLSIECIGPRKAVPMMDAIAAARRWSDGWRGGLLGTCWFDRGFLPGALLKLCEERGCEAIIIVDPAAGLVDAKLVDGLVEHAAGHVETKYVFMPAAPGLSGFLLKKEALERLAGSNGHPGRLLGYWPEAPIRDPLAGPECAATPTSVARTSENFLMDSRRRIGRIEAAIEEMGESLMEIRAEELVRKMNARGADAMPRDVVIELNTRRATQAIFRPGEAMNLYRKAMGRELAASLFRQLDGEVRVTFAGMGDPLLHGEFFGILEEARAAGIKAIHVETDLVGIDAGVIERLATAEVDVLSVHLPGMTPKTYRRVMGIDGLGEALENLQSLVSRRHDARRLTPIVVPTFVKCGENLHEMEAWYDQWIKAVGSAVILGASDYGGQIADVSVADMSPPKRVACRRLASRMSILCDGRIVSCEEDVTGVQPMEERGAGAAWRGGCGRLRQMHQDGRWGELPLCGKCREWHRP